jgi:hypothetical protein
LIDEVSRDPELLEGSHQELGGTGRGELQIVARLGDERGRLVDVGIGFLRDRGRETHSPQHLAHRVESLTGLRGSAPEHGESDHDKNRSGRNQDPRGPEAFSPGGRAGDEQGSFATGGRHVDARQRAQSTGRLG